MCNVLRQGSEVCNWYQLANSPSLQSRRILLCNRFGLLTDWALGRVKKWFNTIKRLLWGYNSPIWRLKEHKCLKKCTVFILHFAPSLRFTLSLQSAFYTQSAVYPWSAVCVLHWPEFEMITDIRHFWNRSLWSWIVVLHCKKCHPVLYVDIIKCLFIDDWVSFVNSLHIEMEAFDCKAVVDT